MTLSQSFEAELTVDGTDQTWVLGKYAQIAEFFHLSKPWHSPLLSHRILSIFWPGLLIAAVSWLLPLNLTVRIVVEACIVAINYFWVSLFLSGRPPFDYTRISLGSSGPRIALADRWVLILTGLSLLVAVFSLAVGVLQLVKP